MIEDFVIHIPASMRSLSGAVFYSGREAFNHASSLYVLGLNPGGKPEDYADATVERHTKKVIDSARSNWSEYRDEHWGGQKGPGEYGIQPSLRHLFDVVDLDPGTVPASNIVFARSGEVSEYRRDFDCDAELCWPFHKEVIDRLNVEVVVLFGSSKARAFTGKFLKASRIVKSWTDGNKQSWKSIWYQRADGLDVVVLAHPSRGHQWTKHATDPTWLVREALST